MNGRKAAWRYLMEGYDGNQRPPPPPYHIQSSCPPPPPPPPNSTSTHYSNQQYHNQYHQPYYQDFRDNYMRSYGYQTYHPTPRPQPRPPYPLARPKTSTSHHQKSSYIPFNPKSTNLEFYCEVCDKNFNSKKKLDLHIQDDHLPCSEPGCKYSGPMKLMEIHQIMHIKDKDGKPLSESKKDISLWLQKRKANFPISYKSKLSIETNQKNPTQTGTSLLEKMLRDAMRSAFGRHAIHKRPQSAFIPDLPKIALQPLSALIPPDFKMKRSRASESVLYSYYPSILSQPPPQICKFILNKKICKKGKHCPFAHDIDAYKNWKNSKSIIDKLEVPRRPPLLYQLLKHEIERYENLLIASLKFIHEKYIISL